MKTQSGFTIIELLIVIAVLGVVLSLAAPSFLQIIQRNQIATQANTIIASLQFARSETINLATGVQVSPIVGGNALPNGDVDWSQGWQVTVDGNNDGDFLDPQDTVVRSYDAVNNSALGLRNAIAGGPAINVITFNSDGSVLIPANLNLALNNTLCSRTINVRLSGSVRVTNTSQNQSGTAC